MNTTKEQVWYSPVCDLTRVTLFRRSNGWRVMRTKAGKVVNITGARLFSNAMALYNLYVEQEIDKIVEDAYV